MHSRLQKSSANFRGTEVPYKLSIGLSCQAVDKTTSAGEDLGCLTSTKNTGENDVVTLYFCNGFGNQSLRGFSDVT